MIKRYTALDLEKSLYWTAWILILFFDITTGAVRYGLQQLGLIQLSYVPKILVLLISLVSIIKWRQSFIFNFIIIVIIYSSLIALFNDISMQQIVFGLTIFIPIIFGIRFWYYVSLEPNKFINISIIGLLVSCLGLLLNVIYETMPWTGFEFVMAGKAIEGSREWTAYEGINRPSGFSRGSVVASAHVMLLTLIAFPVVALKSRIWSTMLGLVGLVFVALTTTKSTLVAIIVTLFLARSSASVFKYTLWVFVSLSIITPFTSILFDYKITPDDLVSQILFSSFDDRLSATWPIGLNSISDNGIFALGRGLSGVGTSELLYGSVSNVLSGLGVTDSFALYLYGNFGLLGLGFLVFLSNVSIRLFESRYAFQNGFGLGLCGLLIFGFTTDAIENPVSAIFIGLAIGATQSHNIRAKK